MAADPVARFNRKYARRVAMPLATHGAWPAAFHSSADSEGLRVDTIFGPAGDWGPEIAAPASAESGVALYLHRSALEYLAARFWGGNRVQGAELATNFALRSSGSSSPASASASTAGDESSDDEGAENTGWSVVFDESPARITLDHDRLSLLMNIGQFAAGGENYEGATVATEYHLTEGGDPRFACEGRPKVEQAKSDRPFTGRRQATRSVLAQRVASAFQADLMLASLVERLGFASPKILSARATDDWLVIVLSVRP